MQGFMSRLISRFLVNLIKTIITFLAVIIFYALFFGMSWLYINHIEWFWSVLIFIVVSSYSAFEAANPS